MIEIWAEAGPCDNSITKALDYVQAAANAGASAIKVQWYNPDTLVVPGTPRYDNTSGSHSDQYEMFRGSIYPYDGWLPAISLARDLGIEFIPSVFDHEALEYAEDAGIRTIKIASGDLTYHSLIKHAATFADRVAISTGAATLDEVDEATDVALDTEIILMACHLEYPTPLTRANIARSLDLQFNFPETTPGFSDHTPGISTFPLIVAAGCMVIEKHFTLAQGKGYDSDFALSPSDLRNAVLSVERTVTLMGDYSISPDETEMAAREGARRSLYAAEAIPAGKPITPAEVAVLRPGTGLPPSAQPLLVGMAPLNDLPKHHKFSWKDFKDFE